jgi:hypothetical protein
VKIPYPVLRAWDRWSAWINVPIWAYKRIEVRRIDVLLVFFGIFCTGYYYWTSGWLGALQGLAMYVLVVMIALWLL